MEPITPEIPKHVATQKREWPRLDMPSHESWVFRAAMMTSFILFLGFTASLYFWNQGINTISKYAYNEEIALSLSDQLNSLKNVYTLQQQLIIERLTPIVVPAFKGNIKVTEDTIRSWLPQDTIGMLSDAGALKIGPLKGKIDPKDEAKPVTWLDRDRLKVLSFQVEFPKGPIYDQFKRTEDILQRYQILGAKLDEEIRPTIFKANSIILLACFVVLGSIFFVYARRFKRRVEEVLTGFEQWSDSDATFRFSGRWVGELRLITGQFNAMADEVEENRQKNIMLEKIASWQIIARKLAHEIKNPLTPIQMMVSQLKRRYKGDDPNFAKLLEDAQSIITEEVAGLRRMVDNFSNFARLPTPEPRPADMVAICRHVVELEKARSPQHEISMATGLEKGPCEVDEDLLRQVLINILKNACEASGEETAKVILELSQIGDSFLITINDNGPGIPKEQQARIFEAYFTTKHTGPSPGMGLGLAVCQKIVMDHGGKISVNSNPGDTTFSIKIPEKAPRLPKIGSEE